ncbi:MAG: hypothetical protein ACFFCM_11130 [Promethearchaeota archaeon]
MDFIFKSKYLQRNQKLLDNINGAAGNLYKKLDSLDLSPLNLSDYMVNYFGKSISNLKGTLQRYSLLLALCLKNYNNSLEDFVFIEYGGGSGIFSLLAKEIGIGTVIYNDIYSISCQDAKKIAESIGNVADEYILGEIQEIVNYCNDRGIYCNAVGSYDVIEHIYNIEAFFQGLMKLPQKSLSLVLASGANPYNPVIKRRIKMHHHNYEFIDKQKEYGHKEGYTLEAYAKIRKKLIFKISNGKLNSEEINLLTRLTRGLVESDIKECVLKYLNSKILPLERETTFPSNTCDPFTGNWAERLMVPKELLDFFTQNGYNGRVIAGVYENRNKLTTKKFFPKININIAPLYNPVSNLINHFINLFSNKGLYLAPYYILYVFK